MSEQDSPEALYIVLISIHGLIRGNDLELGRDPDTGGQTKYVIELAKALSGQTDIERVDLVTRLIRADSVSTDYAEPLETLAGNAQIVRIECGPDDYIPKEQLWDYLDGFTDNLLVWLHQQPRLPDILHSHYADAGYVGLHISQLTGIPLVHTGHSLGRDKCRRLLATGMILNDIEQRYHILRRIDAEEDTLAASALVIASTRNEIEDQYELYDCYAPEKMAIIPPGINLTQFHPPSAIGDGTSYLPHLRKFLSHPDKPIILALSRPDERKNIIALLEAYGESPRLQALANLVIVAGNRDDIREMADGPQRVLTELLMVIDFYDLYGLVAIPKHHSTEQVGEIFRLASTSHGVFVNPALTEPFGLTLLEAAASGLPLIATENGGPVDIIGNCQNGLLIDPFDVKGFADALLTVLENPALWQQYSASGIENVAKHYLWQAHARAYLSKIRGLPKGFELLPKTVSRTQASRYRKLAICTEIDNTLLGDAEGLEQLVKLIREQRKKFLFCIGSGRRLDSALAILKAHKVPKPDILITSLGTEIHYAQQLISDISWSYHIDHGWTPHVLRRLFEDLPGLKPQPKSEQSRFKLSYFYDAATAPSIEEINSLLHKQDFSVNVTLSFGQFLDIVPARASKGQALRYIVRQRDIPLQRVLATGGSGGDEDMLRGNTLGVVVANRHSGELSTLAEMEHVYFAMRAHAWGILEAIEHYDFFNL
ncbi:HAD-IIB family hydrolase [Methylomonas rhizoryzae]|uniref:HAD-IIB family hydrolase n=1 Tax=Methylomonas rhizoryzae TaxID=2608981 RepID=UPI001231CCC7|nr:HAD-IIB family hydrolase [Methylomonas rhizoryzae]